MYILPTLDDAGKRVLRVMQHSGVAAGWQLMSEASMNEVELSTTAAKLIGMGLISANGSITNTREIGQVYFNIQPSANRFAEMVLNSPS